MKRIINRKHKEEMRELEEMEKMVNIREAGNTRVRLSLGSMILGRLLFGSFSKK